MIALKPSQRKGIAPLFKNWEETLIWSCLQGHMGETWADRAEAPRAALVIIGDFFFLAGDASAPGAAELTGYIPGNFSAECALFVPQNEAWAGKIEAVYGSRAVPGVRYAIKKEPGIFRREQLEAYRDALPRGYVLRDMDESVYALAKKEAWSQDLVSQFPTARDYVRRGLGVAALYGDTLAAGASSYTVYDEGIEIEIDTKREHRRKGLALACGAALILRCLDRGLYPSWDAANLASVALAEKLGYHLDHEYRYYEVSR